MDRKIFGIIVVITILILGQPSQVAGEKTSQQVTTNGKVDVKFTAPGGITKVTVTVDIIDKQYSEIGWFWYVFDENGHSLDNGGMYEQEQGRNSFVMTEPAGSELRVRLSASSYNGFVGVWGGNVTANVIINIEDGNVLDYLDYQLTDNQFGLRNWIIFCLFGLMVAGVYYFRRRKSEDKNLSKKSKILIVALLGPLIFTLVIVLLFATGIIGYS